MKRRVCLGLAMITLVAMICSCCDIVPWVGTGSPEYKHHYLDGFQDAYLAEGRPDFGDMIRFSFETKDVTKKDEGFEEMCEYYGDTGYDRWVSYVCGMGPIYVLTNRFTDITVTCDSEFCGVPAGEPLDELVEILALSPKPYIDSGYEAEYDWSVVSHEDRRLYPYIYYIDGRPEVWPIRGLLSEIDYSQLQLLLGMNLRFVQHPEEGEYNMHVHFEFDGGVRSEMNTLVKFVFGAEPDAEPALWRPDAEL